MQLTSTVIALSTFLSFALAAPQATPSTTTVSSTAPTSTEYYLKTQVIHGSQSSKNDLYVSAYHTGAGFNDATLGPLGDGAAKGFWNGTYQQFDLGTTFPWGFALGGDSNYAGWEAAQINVGYGTADFFLNATGLQWNSTSFGGWLACDWFHGIPQLFWKNAYYSDGIPCSCADIDLIPVPV